MGKPTQHIAESSRMKTLPWKPPSEVLVAVLFLLKRIQWKEKEILTPSMRWGPHLPGLAWFHKQPLCLWAFFPFNCISKVSHRSPGVSHVLGFQGEGQQGLRPGLWFNVHCDLIQRTKLTASDRCSQCYFMYLSKILCWSETTPSQTHSTTEVVSDPREKSQGIIRKLIRKLLTSACAGLSPYLAILLNEEKGKSSMHLLLGNRKYLVCHSFKLSNNNSPL